MSLAPGSRLGPYEIGSLLGAGGMGEVYRGRDSRLGREVAIKVLPERLASNAEAMARFEREARAVAALSHPNILAIHDFGRDKGVAYAVTELLEGETLRARVTQSALPWRKAVEIGVAIAEGLASAHAKGITHRDLKPENIFLTADGRVKILDFGLARFEPRAAATESAAAPTETEVGTVMGTVGYMSPEQVRGQKAEAPSDIFSFGCGLYEMVSGQRAFQRATTADTMSAILNADPPPLAESGKQGPPELARVIGRCLEKDPSARFHSAHDLALALQDLRGTGPSVAAREGRESRPWWIWAAAVSVVLLLAVLAYFLATGRRAGGGVIDSIAVLPLANASGNADAEYLSDGLTESLINDLSRLPRLKVMSLSAVARYKGKAADAQAVGRELGVRGVLTGRLIQRGDAFSISVALVDARDNSHIWGEQYSRKLADVLAVQQEISREVVEKLRLRLTGEEQQRLAKQPTRNSEAYQLYLKARFYANRFTKEGVSQAEDYVNQALRIDPNFALAYVALADAYSIASDWHMHPREAGLKSKEAARKALAIDDSLAEAHASLAMMMTFYDWDWKGAEAEYRHAIQLNPAYPRAPEFFSFHLCALQRFDEAMEHAKRVVELDPVWAVGHNLVASVFYFQRDYSQAEVHYRKAMELDPNFYLSHLWIGWSYEAQKKYPEAIAAMETAAKLAFNPQTLASLAHVFAVSGQPARARKVLDELIELSKTRYVPAYEIGVVYLGLGQKDKAFEWLEKAYNDRSWWLANLNIDPRLDPLRGEARFQDLVRRVGLP